MVICTVHIEPSLIRKSSCLILSISIVDLKSSQYTPNLNTSTKMVNKFGTFQKTAKQADCDFYAAVYGKEESQKSLGSQITIINRDCGHGSLGCQWIFSDPPMNIFFVFHVNTEQSVNLPHYGGMNKVKFMETDDGYDVTMESEKYGKTHLVEKYSDEGITHVSVNICNEFEFRGRIHFSQ